MSERLTIVCILCPAHSGSTLLELLLGAHSRIFSGGEVKVFGRRERDLPPAMELCTCGQGSWRECGFWRRVDERLRSAGARSLAEIDVDHADPRRFREDNLAFFDALSAASGRRILVDSSKLLWRFERLAELPELDLRPVRLIRRPEGVVASHLRSGQGWVRWARAYRHHMLRSHRLLDDRDHLELRYEDLATRTAEVMPRIMDWLGLSFEPAQLEFRAAEQHSVAGNGWRLGGRATIELDRRWNHELSAIQKAVIHRLADPRRVGESALDRIVTVAGVGDKETPRTKGMVGPRALEKRPGLRRWRRSTSAFRAGPDFVIAGVQRGGTTTLFRSLSAHPCVVPAIVKEVHFFDREENYSRGMSWYRSHFPTRWALRRAKRRWGLSLTGEATPAYLQPCASIRLVDAFPDLRVLVLVRDPVERAYSAYKFARSKGGDGTPFAELVEREISEFPARRRLREEGVYRGILETGLYAEQLAPVRDRLGDRLLVLRSEDFFADPATVYERVLRFLRLPSFWPKRFKKQSRSPDGDPMDEDTRRRLVRFYEPHNARLEGLLGWSATWPADP